MISNKICAIILCLFFSSIIGIKVDVDNKAPIYKYHYQTEENMKASASEIPYYGFRGYESGYYPQYPGGYYEDIRSGNGEKWNGLRNAYGDFYPEYRSGPYFRTGYGGSFRPTFYPHQHGFGGEYIDKKSYNDENKKASGERYDKAEGSKGESGQHGSQGFAQGQVALKDIKGDSGYYNNQQGDKKGYNDGKSYQGGQQFNEAGGKGQGENEKSNHRKGHSKKGYKKSHHKDETGNEETYYDEAHDEGDSFRYGNNEGSFGTKGQSSYKGGHENGQFIADEKRKQGHYDKQHAVDNANGDKGQYGQKGYHGSSQGFSVNNGIGEQSLLGRQEANRLYYNQHPHGYVPIFDGIY